MVGAPSLIFIHVLVFIDGDLGPQRFRGSFHLLGADVHPRQLLQQPTALFKAHQRCRTRGHAQNAGRQRKRFQPQSPVARAESALALVTVIVSALEVQTPQYAFEVFS